MADRLNGYRKMASDASTEAGPRVRWREPRPIENYDAPHPYVFPLFLAFIAFSYLQAGIRFPVLGAIRVEFGLGLLLSVFAILAIAKRAKDFKWTAVGKWGLALVLLLFVMTVYSVDPVTSWSIFSDRVFKFSLLGFFIAAFVTNPVRLRLFLIVFLLVAAKLGQEGLHGTITGSMLWENQGIPRLHGSTPNYGHPNSFSGMAVGMLPFVVFIYPLVSWKWRLALAFLALMLLNIVLRTGSRTGYVGFFAGLLWLLSRSRHKLKTALGVSVLVLIAIPFIPDDYVDRFETIFEPVEIGEDTSSGKRKEILVDAWAVFVARPLGVGVGAFPTIRAQWFGRLQDTHNLYLEVATNAGIQGFLIFMGLVVAIFISLRRTLTHVERDLFMVGWKRGEAVEGIARNETEAGHIRDLLWLRASCLALTGFLIIRLVLGIFGHDLYERYWWFLAGSAIALWNISSRAHRKTAMLVVARDSRHEQSGP
jgi:putative inorganic carbon (hco3(-)) transporter